MKTSSIKISVLAVLAVVFVGAFVAMAQSPAYVQTDWDTNLSTPAVPPKASAAVARHINNISKTFRDVGFETSFVRKNEVLAVTIPASELFGPNSTDLLDGAVERLSIFTRAIEHPDSYRILIAVHSDDTGDNTYSDRLTRDRAEVVLATFESMARQKHVTPNVKCYWFGRKRPAVENNSVVNRSRNRRVEIYIVPEKRTIDAARSGNFH